MTRLAPVPTDFVLDDLTWSLLIGSAVLLVAVAAVRISVRSGLPSLLIFLGIGLVLGEKGLGIGFDSEELTQVLGYCALVLILAEGGLTTRWSSIRRSVAPAAVLSTVGVFVSVGVVAVAARYVLHLDWTVALLIGAILSSTDAAAVFSVLRTVPLPRRLSGMLEAESGFNDAPGGHPRRRARGRVGPSGGAPPLVVRPARGGRRAGRRDGDRAARRLGRSVAPAPRCGRLVGAVLHRGRQPGRPRVCDRRHRPHVGLHRRLPLGPRAREPRAAAPGGRPQLLVRPRLDRPDRAVRPARPARLAGRAARADRPGRSSSGWSCCSSPGRCPCWSR